MANHLFIFSAGSWQGEGKIVLNMVEEQLNFNTKWTVQDKDLSGKVSCSQDVHIQGLAESMRNELSFYNFQNKTFSVDMENQNVGRIVGIGVYDEKMIAWEFRNNDMDFEGYETYQLQPDGSYQMKGEYVTSDQFRTFIEARIWMSTSQAVGEDDHSQSEGEE